MATGSKCLDGTCKEKATLCASCGVASIAGARYALATSKVGSNDYNRAFRANS